MSQKHHRDDDKEQSIQVEYDSTKKMKMDPLLIGTTTNNDIGLDGNNCKETYKGLSDKEKIFYSEMSKISELKYINFRDKRFTNDQWRFFFLSLEKNTSLTYLNLCD